jgi:hypothetical protein
LPSYIEYGGRATAPPPFLSLEGVFRGYLLEGDAGLIAKMCERMLNGPAGGITEYRPLFGKWVLMQTGAFGKVSSQAPGFENWGTVNEAQISLWIPLAGGRTEGGVFVPDRIGMAVPYILVNNPMSYAGGREVYGYPKTLGRFAPASAVGDPQTVEAFGGDFAPTNEADWHVLFELARSGHAAQAAEPPQAAQAPQAAEAPQAAQASVSSNGSADAWYELEEAQRRLRVAHAEMESLLPPLGVIEDIINAITGKATRQIFLKQFRDVQFAGEACYQAVVEAPIEPKNAKVRPSLDEWQITVHHLDSHPVTEELGIQTQTTRLSFDVQMDFVAAAGHVVAYYDAAVGKVLAPGAGARGAMAPV